PHLYHCAQAVSLYPTKTRNIAVNLCHIPLSGGAQNCGIVQISDSLKTDRYTLYYRVRSGVLQFYSYLFFDLSGQPQKRLTACEPVLSTPGAVFYCYLIPFFQRHFTSNN